MRLTLLCLGAAVAGRSTGLSAIAVRGNKLVDPTINQTLQLRGVSHSSGEYRCVHSGAGGMVFEGPISEDFVAAVKSWGNNALRIPLNEDCWLGINGVPGPSGNAYITQVSLFVDLLTRAGMVAILDLHWAAPDTQVADKQLAVPDKSHSAAFWAGVAKTFAANPLVMFELYNEPFPDLGSVKPSTWLCLQTGACEGARNVTYPAAGMNDLVAAVRMTGATNVVLVSGLVWTNDLDGWLDHVPHDPLNNLAAVWHSYDFNGCNHMDCWKTTIAPVAAKYPVVVTESGFHPDYVQQLWPWCEHSGISYMAWTWNTWVNGQGAGEGLVTDYNGTPSIWGKVWKAQLESVPPGPLE